jgi:hypothetical protein
MHPFARVGIDPVELQAQREQTRAFILADAKVVWPVRRPITADGAGGYTFGAAAVQRPVWARLVPQQDVQHELLNADGAAMRPTHVLVAEPGAGVERWDVFVVDGTTYEVLGLNEQRQYELKAEVVRRG